MAINNEFIGTTNFLDILNSGNLSLYMQKQVMLEFPLLNWFDIKPTQNGNKFDVLVSEPSIRDDIALNGVSQSSEASDFPNLRFGEPTWDIGETTSYKESFKYTTKLRNTAINRVKKMASKAASILGNKLNDQTTDILFNSAGIKNADMDFTVNPDQAMGRLVNMVDDLSVGFIPDTIFLRSNIYNAFNEWINNAKKGIAYVNPATRTESRVSSYIGIQETDLNIKDVFKIPNLTKLPDGIDYVAFDSRAEVGYLYNALKSYELPEELSSYAPALANIDADNQFISAFENLDNSNPSQFRTFLMADARLGILEPNSIISGQVTI